jgi:hypothetical protein
MISTMGGEVEGVFDYEDDNEHREVDLKKLR